MFRILPFCKQKKNKSLIKIYQYYLPTTDIIYDELKNINSDINSKELNNFSEVKFEDKIELKIFHSNIQKVKIIF